MNAQFLSPLRLERAIGRDEWYLLEPLKFYSRVLRRIVNVPPGFQTDFASVPWFFWRVMPKNGAWDAPAVLHDAIYRGVVEGTRKEADDVFLEAMLAIGVPAWRAKSMWLAVRLFGAGPYQERAHV